MINIIRISSNVDYDIPYDVYIDNVHVLTVYNRETKSIQLKDGNHTIYIKSSKYRSNEVNFDIYKNENIDFEVSPDYKNNALSKFFTSTLYGKLGIKIEKKNDFYL